MLPISTPFGPLIQPPSSTNGTVPSVARDQLNYVE
jgi:hypothetical protein